MLDNGLDNIGIEKDIVVSMTKEIGDKIGQVIKSNFSKNIDDITRSNNILSEIKKIKIKEAFKLEEERG